VYLSEMVPAGGKHICSDDIEGIRNKYRSSPYKWPLVQKPYIEYK